MQHVGRIFGLMLQYLHSGRVPGRLLWPLVNSRWSDIENLLRCLIATVTPIGPYLRAYTENLFSNWHFDVTCGTNGPWVGLGLIYSPECAIYGPFCCQICAMCLRVAWGVMLGSVLAPFTISIEGRWPSLGVYLDGVASGKSQSTASIVVCASGDVVGCLCVLCDGG